MERRSASELRLASDASSAARLVGYAAVFRTRSRNLGGFTEIVQPSAFSRSLSEDPDVVALVHHRPDLVLGRTSSGTLRLKQDERGLAFDITLPDTTAGRDVLVGVERGDIRGASFAFTVPEGGDRWSLRDGEPLRELLDIDLLDVTVTSMPAYTDTSVARRALEKSFPPIKLMLAKRYLETLGEVIF